MRRNAVVILVDRLGTGHLGPYGNTWVETPAFNRLATESLVWEQAFASSLSWAATYDRLRDGDTTIWDKLRSAGVATAMVTDEPELAASVSAASFAEWIECQGEPTSEPAASPEETAIARPFMAALDWLDSAKQPFCLWLHCRGMSAPWDAPHEFRTRFADEEDPDPPQFVTPPDRELGESPDPDELLGLSQAYAAQVVMLDMCLEMLLDHLAAHRLIDSTLLILMSPRGYALGEHGRVGRMGDDLYEEVLHVPLLVRHPQGTHALVRSQTLVHPSADLAPTLRAWFDEPTAETPASASGNLMVSSNEVPTTLYFREAGGHAVRTPAWFLRVPLNGSPQLFAKPDDRWEVNEVSGRCGNVVEELTAALHWYEELAAQNRLHELPPLADHLMKRID